MAVCHECFNNLTADSEYVGLQLKNNNLKKDRERLREIIRECKKQYDEMKKGMQEEIKKLTDEIDKLHKILYPGKFSEAENVRFSVLEVDWDYER
jgi:hypothetical protein